MPQHWNNVLSFVKLHLGGSLNLIELKDEEIIENLKEQVLPQFCQYLPQRKTKFINWTAQIPPVQGKNQWLYTIPLDEDEEIIDILAAYPNVMSGYGATNADTDPYYGTKYSRSNIRGAITAYGEGSAMIEGGGMIDMVINNTFLDILDYTTVRNTWEFFPPNIIAFDQQLSSTIIEYGAIHQDLSTILPDYYESTFKPMCLANVMKWLVALRSKYESITTPMGEIKLNWQKLETDAANILQEVQLKLSTVPMKVFVHISV